MDYNGMFLNSNCIPKYINKYTIELFAHTISSGK